MTSLNNNDMLVCKIKYHGALIYFILSKLHYLVNAFVYGNFLKQMTNFFCKKDNTGEPDLANTAKASGKH